MARLPHNISKSGFRRGEYVLHLDGAQRIIGKPGDWRVCGLLSLSGRPLYAGPCRTLADLADRAEKIATNGIAAD